MGTGKTTVASILARRLSKDFLEMDEIIEERRGKKISEIFAEEGQEAFRNLEHQLLKEISGKTDLLVSCGGGLICREDNLKLLKASGIIVSLTASPAIIYERVKKYTHRPLLDVLDPLSRIKELLASRQAYYELADCVIDTNSRLPEEVADDIESALRKRSLFE